MFPCYVIGRCYERDFPSLFFLDISGASRESISSGRSPMPQAQRTVAITGMVGFMMVAKLAAAAVELAVGSESSKSSSE